MYGGTRDVAAEDEALAAFGLKRDGPAPEDAAFEVWPDNWHAVKVFAAAGTQWMVGMAGPTGLRYEALPFVLRMCEVPPRDWPDVFAQLRVCESEALRIFSEKRRE